MIDYYEILGVTSSASPDVIKLAFRQLAKEFHPDKTDGSKASVDYFLLLKNAYETLTTPTLKKKYLEARWSLKANGGKFDQPIYNSEHILKKAIVLKKRYYYSDIYRTDNFELSNQLSDLLSKTNIEILNQYNEINVNNAIVQTIIPVIELLSFKKQDIYFHLVKQINIEQEVTLQLDKIVKYNQQAKIFHKLTPLLLLLTLICLCLIIIWMIK